MHLVEDIRRVILGLELLQSTEILTVDVTNDRVTSWSRLASYKYQVDKAHAQHS